MATNFVRSVSHFLKSKPNSSMDEFTAYILSMHFEREITAKEVSDIVAATATGRVPVLIVGRNRESTLYWTERTDCVYAHR